MKITRTTLSDRYPVLYSVNSPGDWYEIKQWMINNNVGYDWKGLATDERGRLRIDFTVDINAEWFLLRWPIQ